jgi:hypothetical protein
MKTHLANARPITPERARSLLDQIGLDVAPLPRSAWTDALEVAWCLHAGMPLGRVADFVGISHEEVLVIVHQLQIPLAS